MDECGCTTGIYVLGPTWPHHVFIYVSSWTNREYMILVSQSLSFSIWKPLSTCFLTVHKGFGGTWINICQQRPLQKKSWSDHTWHGILASKYISTVPLTASVQDNFQTLVLYALETERHTANRTSSGIHRNHDRWKSTAVSVDSRDRQGTGCQQTPRWNPRTHSRNPSVNACTSCTPFWHKNSSNSMNNIICRSKIRPALTTRIQ